MKTEISRFCVSCADTVASLPGVLDTAAAQFERRADALGCSLAILNDTRAHLRSLTDKLKGQQAYLLIFGPLKSGKSTLMNAISGSYVSEVTSLPGYPCLVFVRDNTTPRYSVTRYNGRESAFPDKAVLADVVMEAHHSLAQQIRTTEARGESFDPRTTFPEAIRRIDIQVPIPALADSATVLVDTPGLYSRMNFGYDVLTREFRDSAACAVFVVKTDNLFLEQVFAEFNQLLGIFSRIFIVVNVDAGKRDLAPDGTLRPSAESEHPERVIEAFTTLSMAGPLREAYEAGRVRIHAVDLLGAASSFLAGGTETSKHRAAFDAFQQDLTEYLNSSDYTREFVRDSLRQAQTLCEDARSVANGAEVAVLVDQQRERASKIARLDARLAATDRLLAADWNAMFARLLEGNARNAADSIRTRASAMKEDMRLALAKWFHNDESLNALCISHWNEALTNTARSLHEDIRFQLARATANDDAGLVPAPEVHADMKVAGFSAGPCGASVLATIQPPFDSTPFPAHIAPDGVPIRKTFVDWLLFRTVGKIRSRMFGIDGTLDIPIVEKEKRFNDITRTALEKHLDTVVAERFPTLPETFANNISRDYTTRTVSEITSRLRALRDTLAKERAELQTPYEIDAAVLAAAVQLEQRAESIATDLSVLAMQENVNLNPAEPVTESVIEPEAEPTAQPVPAPADSPAPDIVPDAIPLLIG